MVLLSNRPEQLFDVGYFEHVKVVEQRGILLYQRLQLFYRFILSDFRADQSQPLHERRVGRQTDPFFAVLVGNCQIFDNRKQLCFSPRLQEDFGPIAPKPELLRIPNHSVADIDPQRVDRVVLSVILQLIDEVFQLGGTQGFHKQFNLLKILIE